MKFNQGFTLLEILIALFIFSILSIILSTVLKTVINAQSGTEKKTYQVRDVHLALLIFSRDIEQTINRKVLDPAGKEEPALLGATNYFNFTHLGVMDENNSHLRRTTYLFSDNRLIRKTWQRLDQTSTAKSNQRVLLDNIQSLHFQYLNQKNKWESNWPSRLEINDKKELPKAIKVTLTLFEWGKIEEVYVIPVKKAQST